MGADWAVDCTQWAVFLTLLFAKLESVILCAAKIVTKQQKTGKHVENQKFYLVSH